MDSSRDERVAGGHGSGVGAVRSEDVPTQLGCTSTHDWAVELSRARRDRKPRDLQETINRLASAAGAQPQACTHSIHRPSGATGVSLSPPGQPTQYVTEGRYGGECLEEWVDRNTPPSRAWWHLSQEAVEHGGGFIESLLDD